MNYKYTGTELTEEEVEEDGEEEEEEERRKMAKLAIPF